MERMTSKLTGSFVVLLLFIAAALATASAQEKPQVIDVTALAARGEAIANADPLAVELRNLRPEGPARRGFYIGMAAAEGQTLPGPGKQRIHDSLSRAEQGGFTAAVAFSLERNRNADLAARGAAIAAADAIVAEARTVKVLSISEARVFYQLGFDIATGIFGDPALGAQGNTATGPGSLRIRDSLSGAGQRGFNASVKLHLSRKYNRTSGGPGKLDPNAVVTPAGKSGTGPVLEQVYADSAQPANSIRVSIRYRKEYGYKNNSGLFVKGPTSCEGFAIDARPTLPGRVNVLIGIHTGSSMRDSNGQYVCDFLVTDVPLNREIGVRADVSNSPAWLTEAWLGGSEPQPPPGHQRLIRNGIQNVTLTASAPRSILVFEMVYSPPLRGPR